MARVPRVYAIITLLDTQPERGTRTASEKDGQKLLYSLITAFNTCTASKCFMPHIRMRQQPAQRTLLREIGAVNWSELQAGKVSNPSK
jgi:hypothetical protein